VSKRHDVDEHFRTANFKSYLTTDKYLAQSSDSEDLPSHTDSNLAEEFLKAEDLPAACKGAELSHSYLDAS
jgi:hypothetical protein